MILETIISLLFGIVFSERMQQILNTTDQSIAIWMFVIGVFLGVVELMILKRYIKFFMQLGWFQIKTINYLIVSLPLILFAAVPFKSITDVSYILITIACIWVPAYLVICLLKPVTEE